MNVENTNKKYQTSKHIMYSCQYHVIFCPKYRRKVLKNGIDVRLKEIILENQSVFGYEIIEMEVMPDHVHLLISVNPYYGVHPVISRIKGVTSNILRNEFPCLKSKLPALWTRAKFISTVGSVSLETVKQYIEDQKGK